MNQPEYVFSQPKPAAKEPPAWAVLISVFIAAFCFGAGYELARTLFYVVYGWVSK